MSRIRSRDTGPELQVRRIVRRLGYRFGTNPVKLPGKPDLVFARRRRVIFVHGCFWHRHACPLGRPLPFTRRKFWMDKFEANVSRDLRVRRQLRRQGWRILVVWQCQIERDQQRVSRRIEKFMMTD